jgi:hypothetical protein
MGVPRDEITEISRSADGGRQEIHSLKDASGRTVNAWSVEGLHGIAFPTLGARVARTDFDPRGVPLATYLESDTGERARITYECDGELRVRRAIEYSTDEMEQWIQADGVQFEQRTERPTESRKLAEVRIFYDEAGRLRRYELTVFEQTVLETFEYNRFGDVTVSWRDGLSTTFDYEYDSTGNWVRRVIHHSAGADEERRSIDYFEDS